MSIQTTTSAVSGSVAQGSAGLAGRDTDNTPQPGFYQAGLRVSAYGQPLAEPTPVGCAPAVCSLAPVAKPVPQHTPLFELGQQVRVNHFVGKVKRIKRKVRKPGSGRIAPPVWQALHKPMYLVQLNRSKRVRWAKGAKQVYLEPGQTSIWLFEDELARMPRWFD